MLGSRARTALASSAAPAGGSPASFKSALPPPDAPSFSFTTTRASRGLSWRIATIAATRSSSFARSSRPAGSGTPSSRKSFLPLLFVPKGRCFGSLPYMGIPSFNASSRSAHVVENGTRCARSGFGISARSFSIMRGRSISFLASERGEASSGETRKRRFLAWLEMTPGMRSK